MLGKGISHLKSVALFCLLSQLTGSNNLFLPSLALGLPLSSKKEAFQLPTYEKLTDGANPNTNDHAAEPASTSSKNAPVDLTPLTLTAPSTESEKAADDTSNGDILKSTVSTTNFVPQTQESDMQVLQSKSIKGDKGKLSLTKQAAAVNVGPIPLLETDNETQKKVDTILDAEKAELADLWEATLTRSPDIQFVVQKLQPTSNQAHLTNILARMLSTAAFGGMGAMSMMSPNMGTYAAASMGGSMIQNVLGMAQGKADKKAKLSQEEELMMFNMVRNICDKLVASFRDYKKSSSSLTRASSDLQDLQGMVAEARAGQDSAKQLEMEYTLRKQQRDLDALADDLRRHRQSLIDLAGADAVAKLDKQLVDEHGQIDRATGIDTSVVNNSDSKCEDGHPVLNAQTDTPTIEDTHVGETSGTETTNTGNPKTQTASTNPSPQS